MKYKEVFEEYAELLHKNVELRSQLREIPKGYLVSKRISGKDYTYHQYTALGKKKSDYIPHDKVPALRTLLAQREPLATLLEDNRKELHRLESAAKILDPQLSRTFFFLKQASDMDVLPLSKRGTALRFAGAIGALEGLPSQEETQHTLEAWAKGQLSFASIYMKALYHYGITEVVV